MIGRLSSLTALVLCAWLCTTSAGGAEELKSAPSPARGTSTGTGKSTIDMERAAREDWAVNINVMKTAPTQAAPRAQISKLKLAAFPKYGAKILLPVQYQKKDENGQLTATGADIPHGIYMFISMIMSEGELVNTDTIKPIIKATIEGMRAECASETPISLRDYQGLECRGKVKVEADVEAIVRGYVNGRKIYFVSVMGSGPWMRSKDVARYLESFEITP